MTRIKLIAVAAILMATTSTLLAEETLKNPATGNPKAKSINAIAFGPGGLLLIADGAGAQLIAVQTGDTTAQPMMKDSIEKIDEHLGGKMGMTGKAIEIVDLAVNPASGKVYFAVRKQEDKTFAILTLDGEGKVGELVLDNVKYSRVSLQAANAKLGKFTDVAWAGDRVLLAAGASPEAFGCQMFAVPAPVENEGKGTAYSAETYHISHKVWETKAPMHVILPFDDAGKKYLVGSFTCTPVVKYPLDNVQAGAKIKGQSVIDMGGGNTPLDMFIYEKDGKSYVLMNAVKFRLVKTDTTSAPYWAVRFDISYLKENAKINETGIKRSGSTETVKVVDDFKGVVQMDRLDKERAVAIRKDDKGGLNLAVLALP